MSESTDGTPQADGFRIPAEWEPQAQTWLLWPQRADVWRDAGVIAPTFDDPDGQPALASFGRLFPDRVVVPPSSREIIPGGGNVHRVSQQHPMARGVSGA